MIVQYWRSFEQLDRFARAADEPHLPAWKSFNRAVRGSGDVGIWHETYRVQAGGYESIYGNMPRVGLAAAGEHDAVGSTGQSAASRIGAAAVDAPALVALRQPLIARATPEAATIRRDRARRGRSGALNPQSALAGLNSLPRGAGPESASG